MLSSTLFKDLDEDEDEIERRQQEEEKAQEEQRAAQAVQAMQDVPPTGDFQIVKKHWLINWLEQLKHRLPPFQVKNMGIEKQEWSQDISDDRLDTVLQQLPAHEMQRLERMFARTAGIVDTISTAMDLEVLDYQVNAAQERHKHRSNAMVTASLDREAEEKKARDLSKPWQLIMARFDKETGAALTIQRAYRAFAERCKRIDFWPSDENPHHWKHWVEFRRQHGWGKEEMYDAKGNKIKRPQPKAEGRVKARYLETQGAKKSQASIAQDFEARTALRNFARAQRMAEILQAKLAKTQECDAKRRELQEKEQARLRAIQARHKAKFSGMDVRGAILDPIHRRALITQSVQELNAGRVLTQPLYRDFKCTQSFANRLNPPAHLFDLMQHFSAIHMYRKKLEIARKRGLPAPPLPEGADAEIIAMYDEVIANLTHKYKEDVEIAYMQRRVPDAPPEGVHDDGVALYHEVLKRFKRLETGYDSDDAQPGKPRVRSLTGYGKDWLTALEQSSKRRRRLLRVRSQGVLGIHCASFTPVADRGDAVRAAMVDGAFAQSSTTQRAMLPVAGVDETSPPVSYCSTPATKPSTPQPAGYPPPQPPSTEGAQSPSNGPPDILSLGYPPPEVPPLPPAPPRKPSMPAYLPLSTSAACKLAASVACCRMRLKRPLQLKDTSEMCGSSWFGLDTIVEGQCSPFACNDLFLLASILRTEWLPAAERAARKSAASSYMRQSSAGSTGVGPGNDADRPSFTGQVNESGAARGLQVLGRRSIAHRHGDMGGESAYCPSRRSTCHNFSDVEGSLGSFCPSMRTSGYNLLGLTSMRAQPANRAASMTNLLAHPPGALPAVMEGAPTLLAPPQPPGGAGHRLRRQSTVLFGTEASQSSQEGKDGVQGHRHSWIEGSAGSGPQVDDGLLSAGHVRRPRHSEGHLLLGSMFSRNLQRSTTGMPSMHPAPPLNSAHIAGSTGRQRTGPAREPSPEYKAHAHLGPMDLKAYPAAARLQLREAGFAGLNPREALTHSTHILHSPSALLDSAAAPRPLSACGVVQANAHLAHVQLLQAVRACAQWATNEDAVLERTAAPAPACSDAPQGEGEMRKEPGDAKDEEGSPAKCKRKAKKAASSLPPTLKTPNPGVPDDAHDSSHELSPWGTFSPAAPGSAPHTDSSNSPSTPPLPPSRPSAFSSAAALPSATTFKRTHKAPEHRASSGSISGAGSLQQLRRAALLGTSGSGALPGEADGKGEKEEEGERGVAWVTPSITWTLIQHAWALGGLPRVHHVQRSPGAKGPGRDKSLYMPPTYSRQQVSTLGVLGRVMADAFVQDFVTSSAPLQEEPFTQPRTFSRSITALDKGLLVTTIRDEKLLGGGPGMLRISSKAVSQPSKGSGQDAQRGDEQAPQESFRQRQSMLSKIASVGSRSVGSRRSSTGLRWSNASLRQSGQLPEALVQGTAPPGSPRTSRRGSLLWRQPNVDSFNASVSEGKPGAVEAVTVPMDHQGLMQQESGGSKKAGLFEDGTPPVLTGSPDLPSSPSTPGTTAEEVQGFRGGQRGLHSLVQSPLAMDPATVHSEELAVPDALHPSPQEQERAHKQTLMQMDVMNVPSALRCGTGFGPKKPRRNQFMSPTQRSTPTKSEQGTFVQQMHRWRRLEQQIQEQESMPAEEDGGGLSRLHHPPSLNQASKWRSPNIADASLVALPSSALGHNSAHQAWQSVPGGAFRPLKSPAKQPDSAMNPPTPLTPPLSPSSARSPRRRQQPYQAAAAAAAAAAAGSPQGVDAAGWAQDSPKTPGKPLTAVVPGSKWGYPSIKPRKPPSALSRSLPTPLGHSAGRAPPAGTQSSASKPATSPRYQPHLYPENRVLWGGEGRRQPLSPQQRLQQLQLQQRWQRTLPSSRAFRQQLAGLEEHSDHSEDLDEESGESDDMEEHDLEGEAFDFEGAQEHLPWQHRQQHQHLQGARNGLLLFGERPQTRTQLERGQQARSKHIALEQRRAALEAAAQQERQAEQERWVAKLAKWEQQQLAKEALAQEASARNQCFARKPIKPLNFEGPFQELPLGVMMDGDEGLGLHEAWEAWQQQQLVMQQQQLVMQQQQQQQGQMGWVIEPVGSMQPQQQVLYTVQPFQQEHLLLHQAEGQPHAAGPDAVFDWVRSSAASPLTPSSLTNPLKPSTPHPQAIPHPHSAIPPTFGNGNVALAPAEGGPLSKPTASAFRSAPASPQILPPATSGHRSTKPPSAGPRLASLPTPASSAPSTQACKAAAAAVVQSGGSAVQDSGSLAAPTQAAAAAAQEHLKLPTAAASPATGVSPATAAHADAPALTPNPQPASLPATSPPMQQQQQQQQQHLALIGHTLASSLPAAAAGLPGQSPPATATGAPPTPASTITEPIDGITGLGMLGGSEGRPSPPAAGQDRGSLRTSTAPSTPLTPSTRGPRSKMSSRSGPRGSPEAPGLQSASTNRAPVLSHAHLTAAPQDWDELFGKGSEPHLPSWMRRLVARTVAAGLTAFSWGSSSSRQPHFWADATAPRNSIAAAEADIQAAMQITRPASISVELPQQTEGGAGRAADTGQGQTREGLSWAEQHFGPLFFQGDLPLSTPWTPEAHAAPSPPAASPPATPPPPPPAAPLAPHQATSPPASALKPPQVTSSPSSLRRRLSLLSSEPPQMSSLPASAPKPPQVSSPPPSAPSASPSSSRCAIPPRVPVTAMWERNHSPPRSAQAARGRTSAPTHGILCKDGLTGVVAVPRPLHAASPPQPMPPLGLHSLWAQGAQEVITPYGRMRTMTPATPPTDAIAR